MDNRNAKTNAALGSKAAATGMGPGQKPTRPANPLKIGRVPIPHVQIPVRHPTAFRGENTNQVFEAPRPVALWHLASLDAPSVAMAWSLAFAWAAHVSLSGRVLVVLALATWCAYVSDRILDARVLAARVLSAQVSGGWVPSARAGVE